MHLQLCIGGYPERSIASGIADPAEVEVPLQDFLPLLLPRPAGAEGGKALVVLEDGNTNAEISAKNIPDVKTARTNTINVYDVLKYNTVIATKAAVAAIEEVYA